jgi:hypothetical protein
VFNIEDKIKLIGSAVNEEICRLVNTAVSHILQFGDANTSPAGDVDMSAGDAHL